jgi:hypothetical protein
LVSKKNSEEKEKMMGEPGIKVKQSLDRSVQEGNETERKSETCVRARRNME